LDDLDDDEKGNEINDQHRPEYECAKWCYSKKHKAKPWAEKKCRWFACSTCPECPEEKTTVVSLDDLDEWEKEEEIEDEQENVHECAKWCYSKKHKNKEWIGKKCDWFACSTCDECTRA
jgi:hypothetical protein